MLYFNEFLYSLIDSQLACLPSSGQLKAQN